MLTVILPSLNVEKYISQCLVSVVNQTYRNLEIICVDAGSTDGTLDIIRKFKEQDSRIKIVNCDKKSYGIQVNMAMDLAKGKYIAIVDTDDFLELDMYDNLVNMAENNKLDYIKQNYYEYYIFQNERVYRKKKAIISDDLYNRVINPKEYPQLQCQYGYLWCGIYNLDFLKKKGIRFNTTPGAAFQDVGFFHQVTYWAQRVMFIDRYGYNYRLTRKDNSVASPNGLKYMVQEYTRLINLKTIPKVEYEQWKKIYKKMIISFMTECEKKIIYEAFDDETVKPYLKEAKVLIKNCFTKNYLKKEDFVDCFLLKLDKLLNNNSRFVYEQNQKQKSIFMVIDRCDRHRKKNKESRIVIYGCGIRGKRLEEILMKKGVYIDGFIDQDVCKIGITVDDIQVFDLEHERKNNSLYIISVKNHEKEIEKYLISNGIKKENICILDESFWS